eukprot:scaffold34134_cov56-Attheya_sp.AAC.1
MGSLEDSRKTHPPGTFRPIRGETRTVISTETWYMKRNGPVEYRNISKYAHPPHPSEYEVSASTLALAIVRYL